MNIRLVSVIAAASIAALGVAGCGSDSSSSSTPAASTTAPATTTAPSTDTTSTAGGAIDGKALFVNGKAGAAPCGGCHAMKAAGTAGTVGPDLDKIAVADDAAAIAEMITDPNGEIVSGYPKDVMPQDYGTTLTPDEITALSTWIDQNSAHAE